MKLAWWAAAPVAIGCMLAASSQPYFGIYRPWSWTQEQRIAAGTPGSFDLPIDGLVEGEGSGPPRRTAEVEVIGFQRVEHEEEIGLDAPDGFAIWALLTQWRAPEDSVLSHCRMWATGSDGRDYQRTDQIFGEVVSDMSALHSCTPPGEGGPATESVNLRTATVRVVQGDPRPEEWRKLIPIAMPEGVQPEQLHLGWNEPDYVTLDLPEPKNYVDDPESKARDASGSAAGE